MEKTTRQRPAALRIPEDLFVIGQPFTRNELGAMVSRGYLRETLPGHYLDVSHRYDASVRAQIAHFVAGRRLRPGEVLCRSAAGWIHGLVPSPTSMGISSPVYRRPVPSSFGLPYEFMQLQLEPDEVLVRGPVPVTSLLRTVCDMACHDPLPIVVDALDRIQRLQDPYLHLQAVLQRLNRMPGSSPVQRGLRLVESMQPQAA